MDRGPLWPWDVGAEHRTSGTTGDGAKQPAAESPAPPSPGLPPSGRVSLCLWGCWPTAGTAPPALTRGAVRGGEPGGAGAPRVRTAEAQVGQDKRPHLCSRRTAASSLGFPHAAPSQQARPRGTCSPHAFQGLTIETALQICLPAESPQDKGPEGHRDPSRRGL